MKSIVSAFLFVLLSTNIPALAWNYEDATQQLPYEEGLGTEDVPYIITNPQQLANLAWSVNHGVSYKGIYFALGNDIDLNPGVTFAADGSVKSGTPKAWTPIGTRDNPFRGNFDGKGHSIKGLYFDEPFVYTGLFGYVLSNKLSGITISESGIYFPNIDKTEQEYYIGMLAGYADDIPEISDCHNEAGITVSMSTPDNWNVIGGLIAVVTANKKGLTIMNCENKGAIKTTNASSIGGLFGELRPGYHDYTISDCTNYGEVSLTGGEYNYAGGIAGSCGYRDSALNLSNFGKIYCSNGKAGGLFGNGGYQSIQNCLNEGDVTGYSNAGGICADGEICNAIDCSNKGNIEALCVPEEPYDSYTNFQSPAGGLFGRVNYVETITGCTNYGQVTSKGCAGGIAGLIGDYSQEGSTVNNCTNNGTIKSAWAAGGIAAQINVENVYELYNNALISGERDYVGGIAGLLGMPHSSRNHNMSKCHNTADITGKDNVGGIIGSYTASSAELSGLSNTGNITGVNYVNGIGDGTYISLSFNLGRITGTRGVSGIGDANVIENCFNAGDISAESVAGGISAYARQTIRNVFNYGHIEKAEKEKSIGSIVGDAYWGVSHMTLENVFYLDGQATPVGGPYVTDDERMISKSKEDFASGAICVALNGEQEPTPWGQNVGVDFYPLLNGEGNPEINGVEDIKTVAQPESIIIFDLNGRHISAPLSSLKGFYIINGKKTFLR